MKNKALAKEKERLRSRRFVPRWHGVLQRPENTVRTVYHNVQSLRAHNRDVSLDEVFMGADILLLAETWLRPDEQGTNPRNQSHFSLRPRVLPSIVQPHIRNSPLHISAELIVQAVYRRTARPERSDYRRDHGESAIHNTHVEFTGDN